LDTGPHPSSFPKHSITNLPVLSSSQHSCQLQPSYLLLHEVPSASCASLVSLQPAQNLRDRDFIHCHVCLTRPDLPTCTLDFVSGGSGSTVCTPMCSWFWDGPGHMASTGKAMLITLSSTLCVQDAEAVTKVKGLTLQVFQDAIMNSISQMGSEPERGEVTHPRSPHWYIGTQGLLPGDLPHCGHCSVRLL
jgi:hypothetical protein